MTKTSKTRKYINLNNLNNIFASLNKHYLGDVQTRGQFLSKKEQSACVKTKKNITKQRKITSKKKGRYELYCRGSGGE